MKRVALPVLDAEGSIRADGTRVDIQPADVRGRFQTARTLVFYALIGFWASLPWIRIGGNPAVFLDIERRRFFLFGATFNAQDIWLLFFLLTGVAFSLVYMTALLGRAWCGWACPQTVFLEGVYRRIERVVEGPREARLRRNAGPMTPEKFVRKGLKHAAFVLASFLIAHIFVSYFVSLPRLYTMVRSAPGAHPEAFAWAASVTAILYGNFAFFREQLCLILCPYGRLQSVLIDSDSLIVGYDANRGEPRGKATERDKGDCVDCKRCVVVCPTGIDIRKGLQLDCIACTACVDACDEVMDKLGRPRGLVRYDSQNGLAGKAKKVVRPRLVLYTVLLVVGAVVASFGLRARTTFEANLLRLPGPPYSVVDGQLQNAFEVHLVNKNSTPATFAIATAEEAPGDDGSLTFVIPMREVRLEGLESRRIPVFVRMPRERFTHDVPFVVSVRTHAEAHDGAASSESGRSPETHVAKGRFLGARP
jgi:cytochrome c oxidase accessory protein FixG